MYEYKASICALNQAKYNIKMYDECILHHSAGDGNSIELKN